MIAALRGQRGALSAGATSFAVSTGVALVAFLVLMAIVALIGYSPTETASAFVSGAFGGDEQIAATVTTMIPLVLLGLGWIVASSARQINLGLEGQIIAGGIGAALVGANLDGLPPTAHVLLTVLAGAAAGAIWASAPALLYVWRNVNSLLSSFMLNFVALLLLAYLIRGPMQNQAGLGLIESTPVSTDALWPQVGGLNLHWEVILIPLAVIAVAVVQRFTTTGFRLRLLGANEAAAEHVGIAAKRLSAASLMCSGALAGIAGSSLLLASFNGSLSDSFSSGYGYIGIAVALLARNHPIGCIGSALLFAALQQGGSLVETKVGVPTASVEVAQGLVIIFVALSAWVLVKISRKRPEAALVPEPDGTV